MSCWSELIVPPISVLKIPCRHCWKIFVEDFNFSAMESQAGNGNGESRKLSDNFLEHVYRRPEVNSNRFKISKRFKKSIHLHGDFTAATCK